MRFPSECYQIHQTLRQTMPQLTEAQSKGLAVDVRNHNRPKRTPELRHRRPDVHGRILRRPPATPRVALRRRRPRRAVAQPDRRPRPLRPAHAMGLVAVDVQRPRARLRGTIIVIWVEGQNEPWILLTDLEPMDAGASGREMRFWIETGFKALKSVGWQWQKTRRTDPARVERRWFVLSVATLLTLAFGSRVDDAQALKRSPGALRAPPKAAPAAQSHRGRVSPWHGDAEPSSG